MSGFFYAMTIKTLLKYIDATNIADEFDDDKLIKLGRDVVRLTVQDDGSRSEWLARSEKAMDAALQVTKEKTFPWPNASNVKYPLITTAALQFHARAYPAIVQGNKIVKPKIIGADKDGAKAQQGQRVSDFMNYQLLEEQEEWEEEMDRLLLALPIEGCEFKKSYYDPALGHNVSEWVRPIDFIVDYKTKSLSTCPRMTHRLWFYPQQILEKQRSGLWSDVDLNISVTDDEEDVLQEFYEQHCLIDLDDDGYKEPYCVTVHKESEKVVRVKAAFNADDIRVTKNGQTVKLVDVPEVLQVVGSDRGTKISKIERTDYFTKYSFIPSPDGGFYDIGFGQLCGPLSNSVDTTINQMLDAGTLSNLQSGFVRDGVSINQKRGPVKFTMGEFLPIKLPASVPINQAIYQMQFPGPSAVLFNLLGFLVEAVKDITSVQDIFTGGQQQNETATTTMARVEQGLKVFTAIYKRIHRCLKKELKILFKLNGKYLQPETYFRVLDTDKPGVVTLQDFRNDGTDVQPVSDPEISTTMQKIAKAEALGMLRGDPGINQDEINSRFLDALEIPNKEALIVAPEKRPQPGPDPKLIELEMKATRLSEESPKMIAETIKTYAEAIRAIADAEAKEAGTQLDQYKSWLDQSMQAFKVSNEQGRAGGMEGAPGNQGSNGPPPEVPGGLPGAMPGSNGPMQPGDIAGSILQGQV
jgi:chaperonin GroES